MEAAAPPAESAHRPASLRRDGEGGMRWLKPRLRRRGGRSSMEAAPDASAVLQLAPQQQNHHHHRPRGRRRSSSSSSSSSSSNAAAEAPPLLLLAAPPHQPPSPSPEATAPAAPTATATTTGTETTSFLPPLLEQLALGAVGALTSAVWTGLAALQQQQQQQAAAPSSSSSFVAAAAAATARPPLHLQRQLVTSSITASSALGGFPLVIQPHHYPRNNEEDDDAAKPLGRPPQRLLAAGTRTWGSGAWWDGRSLMKVRIYDFALYADPAAVAAAAASSSSSSSFKQPPLLLLPPSSPHASPSPSYSLSDALATAAPDVPVTVLLRAARDVPLSRLADEFERILRRRLARAAAEGGNGAVGDDNTADPVAALLEGFRDAASLPRAALSSTSGPSSSEPAIARGASFAFERLPGGRVLARCFTPPAADADGGGASATEATTIATSDKADSVATLADVTSPALCLALFGLYLADQPVSESAKAAASDSLARMLKKRSGGRDYLPRCGDRVVCDLPRLEISPLEEHDACVLVPGHD